MERLQDHHFSIGESDKARDCEFPLCGKSAKISRHKWHLRKVLTEKEKPAMKRDRMKGFLGRENCNCNDSGIGRNLSGKKHKVTK